MSYKNKSDHNAQTKKWRESHKEYYRDYWKKWYAENKEKHAENARKWRSTHHEQELATKRLYHKTLKWKAYMRKYCRRLDVAHKLKMRGFSRFCYEKKNACELCGFAENLEMHHKVYGKNVQTDVMTVCHECHLGLKVEDTLKPA